MNKISSRAQLGQGVTVGDYSVVHDNVVLGDGVTIGSHCILGETANGELLEIGEGSTVRSHSVIYEGSTFGPGLQTGHHVIVRPGVRAGKGLVVGSQGDLEGRCTFGDWTRLHSDVHIAQHSKVGSFVFLFPRVLLTNDPFPPSEDLIAGNTIEDMAVVATGTLLLPGVKIGLGSYVVAGSRVQVEVPAGRVYGGDPAKSVCRLDQFFHPQYGRYHPWIRRFMSRYPEEANSAIDATIARIDTLLGEARNASRTRVPDASSG